MSYLPQAEDELATQDSHGFEPASSEPGTSIIKLSKPAQYAILALFALYAPSAIGTGPLFDPYLQLLLLVSLVFGSLLVSTANLAGPLRYTYHNYAALVGKAHPLVSLATAKVTAWAPLPFVVLALLPWFRTWFFMGAIPLAWQYVREEHQQAVRETSDRVDGYCTRAEAAVKRAQSDAEAASQCLRHLEQNLRAAAFYEEPSAAWTTPLDSRSQVSSSVVARQAQQQQQQQQQQYGAVVRGVLATHAEEVAGAADSVAAEADKAFLAGQESLRLSSEVHDLATRAKTAAREGRMADQQRLALQAEAKLGATENASAAATAAKEKAGSEGRAAYVGWLFAREQHREQVVDVARRADKACIRAASLSALARAERVAVEEHERAASRHAADAARDARAAHHVRLADFYVESAPAWAKLQDYTNAVQDAVGRAEVLSATAAHLKTQALQFKDKTSGLTEDQARHLNVAEVSFEVLGHIHTMQQDGAKIRDKVDRFKRAATKTNEGRKCQAEAARGAAETLAGITADVQAAAEAATHATEHADEVRQHALDAKAAVARGDNDVAKHAMGELDKALKACGQDLEDAIQKRENVQASMAMFAADKYLCVVANLDLDPADLDPVQPVAAGWDSPSLAEQSDEGGESADSGEDSEAGE
ncbi:hypothetical protein MFIFM68171_02120 [Madurella fahalii]|uniref:Uncharacterized protein n=1 Tax=Madurella fahalii TaxID=1157608 RepID=A0ABQ0G2X4_9PEZI